MTEQKQPLPTVAKIRCVEDSDSDKHVHFESRLGNIDNEEINDEDEVIRREDVKQLIKDRITAYDDRELNDVEYGRYKELLKLLQEVKSYE